MNNHRLYELSKPVVFAHRGAKNYAPENTLASFQKALEMGAQALELDITLTKDDEVVVIHDDTVDRTTDGKGAVNDLELAEIKKLDAGSWFSNGYLGERIPTLKEVLDLVQGKALINIEIKNAKERNRVLVQKAANLVREKRQQESIIFSSFYRENVRMVRKELPDCPVGFLTLPGFIGKIEIGLLGGVSPDLIHPHFSSLSAHFIERQHAHLRRVHSYTINDADLMRTLVRWGVDGFFCDDLVIAQQVLSSISY
jgi:glycerophosphoryl diester phosphodiesterase